MAQIFTGWSFDKALDKSIDRKNQVKQFEEVQNQRYVELAERITARKAADAYREKALKEEILHRQKAQEIQMRGQDINRDLSQQRLNESQRQFEVGRHDAVSNREDIQAEERWKYKEGKTKEERALKDQSRGMVSTIPTFEEYDQNEAVTEAQDFIGFDEGEFRDEADKYIDSIQANVPSLIQELKYNPNSSVAKKHLDDLEKIYEVFDGGEYSGPLDSYLFNFFDGEATGAKKSKAKIKRILNSLGRQVD
jgi:hypothetical protein